MKKLFCKVRELPNWSKSLLMAVLLLTTYVVIVYFHFTLSEFSTEYPFMYGGDPNLGLMTMKISQENGGVVKDITRLGYPDGTSLHRFQVFYIEYFKFLVWGILGFFTSGVCETWNVYMLTIPLMNLLICYAVFRSMKISRLNSYVGAVAFAFCYYYFARIGGHDTLASFYFVPLSFLLCFWCEEDNRLLRGGSLLTYGRNWLFLLFCFCIAGNGNAYYPFFTCMILGITMIDIVINRKGVKKCLNCLTAIGAVAVFFFLSTKVPVWMGWVGNETSGVVRSPAETEIYGLRLSTMFLSPNGFFVPALKSAYDVSRSTAVLLNENETAYLGVIGICGLLSLFVLFMQKDNGRSDLLDDRRRLLLKQVVCMMLYATIAGIGLLFSIIITRQIRCTNRVSIFIQFACVLAFVLLLEQMRRANKGKYALAVCILAICVTAFNMVDLTGQWRRLSCANAQQEFSADKTYVEQVEASAGKDGVIFQIPFCGFPEYHLEGVPYYHYLLFYLHSDGLSTVYGAPTGSENEIWYRQTASLPTEQMLEEVHNAGFSGISVDWRPYSEEDAARLRQEMEALLGAPSAVREGGTTSYYSLEAYVP